jgi:Uma2 family endonuclease
MMSRSQTATTADDPQEAVAYTPYRLSVDDVYRMVESGVLRDDERVELLDGQLYVKEPIGPPHASRTEMLADILRGKLGKRAMVRTRHPAILDSYNAPEPDILVVKRRDDYYLEAHPTPADVLLAIEIAWTSGPGDRRIKSPLYARAGIPEFWIVDLRRSFVDVYQTPEPSGYQSHRRMVAGDALRPLAFQDIEVPVSDILLV